MLRGVHGGELMGYMIGGLVGWVKGMEDGGSVIGCKCRVED